MSKKNILIIIICAVVVVTTAVIIVAGGMVHPLEQQMRLGYKYLVEGSYDQAVLAFTKAIEIAPKDLRPRVALANTQIAMGDDAGAKDTVGDIGKTGGSENLEKDNPPEGYNKRWYTLRELVEWLLDYNVKNGLEGSNNTFITEIEACGLNLYDRQPAPSADRESGTYQEEFVVALSSLNGGAIYYTLDGRAATYQSAEYEAPIRVLENQTLPVQAVTADKYFVSSKTLELQYQVKLPELSGEGDWRFDGYEELPPNYEVERKYEGNQPTDQTRRTGRVKPQEGEQGKLQEWRYGGFENQEPYREYEALYVNGGKTEKIRYTGKTAAVEWKIEGYETIEPYKEYEIKYINGQKTNEKRYTGQTKNQSVAQSNVQSVVKCSNCGWISGHPEIDTIEQANKMIEDIRGALLWKDKGDFLKNVAEYYRVMNMTGSSGNHCPYCDQYTLYYSSEYVN